MARVGLGRTRGCLDIHGGRLTDTPGGLGRGCREQGRAAAGGAEECAGPPSFIALSLLLRMRIDLPSPRAASGSFFEPNSKMIMIATISRGQGSSPLRSMPQVPSPYSWLPACATVQPQAPSPPHSSESFLWGAAA